MKYILTYSSPNTEVSRHCDTIKEAQKEMRSEFSKSKKLHIHDKSTCFQDDNYCFVKFSNKEEEIWNIISVDIPKNENICVTYKTNEQNIYFTTQKENATDNFFLYRYNKENFTTTKLGKGKNPLELEKKYIK